jgi:hypothetical protein
MTKSLPQQQFLFAATNAAKAVDGEPTPKVARATVGTVLISRTIMLTELTVLLNDLPADASRADYRSAIEADNLLRKTSAMNRRKTASLLTRLYGLDPRLPVFRALRRLWDVSPEGRPLLAFLAAYTGEPLLRAPWPLVRDLPASSRVGTAWFVQALAAAFPNRFNAKTAKSTAQNVASSWMQAGYFSGALTKVRTQPTVTPAVVALALFLGYLEGLRGHWLFRTAWTELLQVPEDQLLMLAGAASRQGILHLLQAGDVVEVRFPGWLTTEEEVHIRGQA